MAHASAIEERYLQYVARAEEARQIALTANDGQVRQTWEHIASGWEQLAQQVARRFPKSSGRN
jgi:hypothetical protein